MNSGLSLNGHRLILSSASPRRKELLEGLGLRFTIDTDTSFTEHYDKDTPLGEIPALMSEGKSDGFHRPLEDDEILITSDTMVYCDDVQAAQPRGCNINAEKTIRKGSSCHHCIDIEKQQA